MSEYQLKYGCNPEQKPARIYAAGELPLTPLNGRPGYINYLDALNSWQLVREMSQALGLPAAASFKHVSPAGAGLGLALSEAEKLSCRVEHIPDINSSLLAAAYARARGTDRMSSFGDWIALSHECDEITAKLIKGEVSDGVIAPGFTPEALAILRSKRQGNYNIVVMNPTYQPPEIETRQVYGITFEQGRNSSPLSPACLENIVSVRRDLPEAARRDLLLSLIVLKYTQSNSVCYTLNGQTLGVGAGQQSRIHCTRLAGSKADVCRLRQHPRALELPFRPELSRPERDNATDCYLSGEEQAVLAEGCWQQLFTSRPAPLTAEEKAEYLSQPGVSLGSDAFFPFSDNLERAARSGVSYVAEPGGSIRDDLVIAAADRLNMVLCFTGRRLFHH